jgi:hypothetical protein
MAEDFFNQQLQEVVRSVIAEQQTPPTGGHVSGADIPGQAPIRLHVGGQDYIYDSPEAASAAVATMQANYEAALNAEKARLAELQRAAASEPRQSGKPDINDRFVEHIEKKDVAGAIGEVINEKIFGGRAADPWAVLQEVAVSTAATGRNHAANEFRAQHPEFPANPQTAATLDQIRQSLGLEFNVQGLEAAYAYAVGKGYIQPYFPGQGQAQPPSYAQQRPPQGPPGVGRGQQFNPHSLNSDQDWVAFAEDQSVEQLEQILNRASSAGMRA